MNREFTRQVQAMVDNIWQVVVARPDVIKMSILGLLCQEHVLLDDFPGVGKTLLAKALAQSIQADFKFVPGPIFANIVLADEVNCSSPRTQAALLETMSEGHVTFDGIAYPLPKPFFIIATRNLAEAHGTFPLPQSQLDRFLLSFGIGYPEQAEEVEIPGQHEHEELSISPVLTSNDISDMQEQIYRVEVAHAVLFFYRELLRPAQLWKEGILLCLMT